MTTNKLILNEDDMGIDMFMIYQSSCKSFFSHLPDFRSIHMEYRTKIIEEECNLPTAYIHEQIRLLEQGIVETHPLQLPSIEMRPEAEVLNYLLLKNYSFFLEEEFLPMNYPTLGVW